MDLSDSSKLSKTFTLNKLLDSLSCNEDSNAADSLYAKISTCEASDQYPSSDSIFGESLFEAIHTPNTLGFLRELENQNSKP